MLYMKLKNIHCIVKTQTCVILHITFTYIFKTLKSNISKVLRHKVTLSPKDGAPSKLA